MDNGQNNSFKKVNIFYQTVVLNYHRQYKQQSMFYGIYVQVDWTV